MNIRIGDSPRRWGEGTTRERIERSGTGKGLAF